MKTWQIVLVGLAALAIAGCQADPNIALLEQRNRRLEDEIYRLRWQLEDSQADLQAAQRCHAAPRGSPATTAPPATTDVPEPGPMEIHVPDQSLPGRQIPDTLKKPVGERNAAPPSPAPPGSNAPPPQSFRQPPGGQEFSLAGRNADSARVRQITFNQNLTGGYVTEENPAEQGLLVVIEPRDGQGRLLAAPADVQVAVLDPKLPGQEARVARWNLTAAEIAAQLRSGPDSGIHLTLPWRNNRPKHAKLHLFVRYLTGDGRKVEADQPIEIAMPSDRSPGWTPSPRRASDWSPADAAPPPAADRSADDTARRPTWSPERW